VCVTEKFIGRYGTHVVVSAKFGGEFKIMHTMRKSKTTGLDAFAQQSIEDAMRMFSRSWNLATSLFVASGKGKGVKSDNLTVSVEAKRDKESGEK
jgi:hypothetical protein